MMAENRQGSLTGRTGTCCSSHPVPQPMAQAMDKYTSKLWPHLRLYGAYNTGVCSAFLLALYVGCEKGEQRHHLVTGP